MGRNHTRVENQSLQGWGCVCDVQALPAATEFCCPLSCLAHTLAVPQLCSEAHREPPSAEVTGALGRHWVHPDTGCAVGEADKLVMVLHCFAGKEELKPVPSAAMENVSHQLHPESSGSNRVNAHCWRVWV